MREEVIRLRSDNAALKKEVEMTRLREAEISCLRSDDRALLEMADEMTRLREEINRLRNDNATHTGGMAETTRRVKVKKEYTTKFKKWVTQRIENNATRK